MGRLFGRPFLAFLAQKLLGQANNLCDLCDPQLTVIPNSDSQLTVIPNSDSQLTVIPNPNFQLSAIPNSDSQLTVIPNSDFGGGGICCPLRAPRHKVDSPKSGASE